jgi:hypothetical protein
MQTDTATVIRQSSDWKRAITESLRRRGVSRYEFVRACDPRICSRHTAECLLASDGTVTGRRKPTIDLAIAIAEAAGFDLVMVPRTKPATKGAKR